MAKEKRKERKDMTHSERIADHYRVLGQDNPFAGIHSGQARARKSGGGLGSKKAAARYERTSAKDRAKANSDGRFGYFDEVNKRYVPAFIDMQDGGGRDTRGDKFKGGMFSELLNDLGVDPYGSQMERTFVSPNTSPLVQAVARSNTAMANQEASFDQPNSPDSPFSGSTYDEVPNMYRFDGSTYDEVRPFTMSGDRGFAPTNIAPPAATSTSFAFQGDRGFAPTNQAMTAATTTPYTFQGDRGFTPTNIAPPAATAERRIPKSQIVPNPDYAVGVQELIDYLQSNKGFMGVDNAIDDYETMMLTGRYPRG